MDLFPQIVKRSQQLLLCRVELVKLLPYIDIVLIFCSYSGPSGILSSDGKQNTAWGVRIVALSISSHEQTQ